MKDVYLCIYYSQETGTEFTFVEEDFEDIFNDEKHPGLSNEEWVLVAPANALSVYEAILVRPCGDRITIEKARQLRKGEKHYDAIQ